MLESATWGTVTPVFSPEKNQGIWGFACIEFDLTYFINIEFINWWSLNDNCDKAIQKIT